MRQTTLALLASTTLLAACGSPASEARRVPMDVRAVADTVVDEVMAGNVDTLRAAYPDADGAEFEAFIQRSASAVRAGAEIDRELVGADITRASGNRGPLYRLAHEVETEAGYTVISQTYGGPVGEPAILRALEIQGDDSSLGDRRRRLGWATRLIVAAFLIGLLLTGLAWLRSRKAEVQA